MVVTNLRRVNALRARVGAQFGIHTGVFWVFLCLRIDATTKRTRCSCTCTLSTSSPTTLPRSERLRGSVKDVPEHCVKDVMELNT